MRFSQIDRITALETGKTITAVKGLSMSEEYLQDHFPRFPVMPGVLMLESMFQASMWLVRATQGFQFSTVVMREAIGLRFQGFVRPGDQLEVVARIKACGPPMTSLNVSGSIGGKIAVSGRLRLESFNLSERGEADPMVDAHMRRQFRLTFRRLCNQLEQNNFSGLAEIRGAPISTPTL